MACSERHGMTARRTCAAAIALGLLVLAQVAPARAQTSEAEQVLEQFERAFNAHDEAAVVGLFAVDGTAGDNLGPGQPITRAEIGGWMRTAIERNLHAHLGEYSASATMTQFTIEVGQGDWYRGGELPMRARGTAEIRGGHIVMLVLSPLPQVPARTTASSSSIPALPLALAAGALVALLAGLLLEAERSPPRPTHGTLHRALEAWSTARKRAGSSR
jgi:hypothetical protein